MNSIVISNATPLIGLATIQQFDLLQLLFQEIYIPRAVYQEVVVNGRDIGGARHEVSSADWVNVVDVKNRLAVEVLRDELDFGEAETIILAQEMNAEWVLMDEKKGRRKLDQLSLPKMGTLGILLNAKRAGQLQQIKPHIEKLNQKGFILSHFLVDTVLKQAGEI